MNNVYIFNPSILARSWYVGSCTNYIFSGKESICCYSFKIFISGCFVVVVICFVCFLKWAWICMLCINLQPQEVIEIAKQYKSCLNCYCSHVSKEMLIGWLFHPRIKRFLIYWKRLMVKRRWLFLLLLLPVKYGLMCWLFKTQMSCRFQWELNNNLATFLSLFVMFSL